MRSISLFLRHLLKPQRHRYGNQHPCHTVFLTAELITQRHKACSATTFSHLAILKHERSSKARDTILSLPNMPLSSFGASNITNEYSEVRLSA